MLKTRYTVEIQSSRTGYLIEVIGRFDTLKDAEECLRREAVARNLSRDPEAGSRFIATSVYFVK